MIEMFLIIYGLCSIITKSYLFKWLRNLPKNKYIKYLLGCSQCQGFWFSLLYCIIFGLNPLLAFASSGVNYFLDSLLESIFKNNDEIKWNR